VLLHYFLNNDVSIAAVPWDVATKESSCEQSQPSGQSKENLVVSTVGANETKKRLFHGTNLLALGGT
jgi:hypothetical protein